MLELSQEEISLLIVDPSGKLIYMQDMLVYFEVLPFADILFKDYLFSGFALIIVNGITNIVASYLILRNKKIGYVLGTIFGVTLMAWISIQFYMFEFFVIDLVYFLTGLLQLIIGYICLVSYCQDYFKFSVEDYKEVNKNSDVLTVFFSRKGYSKKIAYEVANKEQAFIEEIKTSERTEGDLGFWWCGRFALHRWGMKIHPLKSNIKDFKKIIIVSPTLVFKMCSPIREFIRNNKDILNDKEVVIVFNHFNPWIVKSAIREVKTYIKDAKIESKVTMLGHTFTR